MPYLLGTDEAGYGPNYGPLVISGTLWHVDQAVLEDNLGRDNLGRDNLAPDNLAPDNLAPDNLAGSNLAGDDLYERLRRVVSATPCGDERLIIADSKSLYKPGQGLAGLERNVLPLLMLCGHACRDWKELFRALAPDCSADLDQLPWYVGFQNRLPVTPDLETWCSTILEAVRAGLREAGVRLVAVRSAVVFPRRFNLLVTRHGTKGAALTELTLQLAAELMRLVDGQPLVVHCDKHGGRNKYVEKLQTVFPEYLVEVRREGREESVYRWGPAERRVEFRFVARGERFLPAALASMTSKYLRELAMQSFNAYWRKQVANLKPTAGYPVDARRFRRDIEPARLRLAIDEQTLWRCR